MAQSVCGCHRNQQVTPIFLNKAHQPVSVRTRVSVQSRLYGMSNETTFPAEPDITTVISSTSSDAISSSQPVPASQSPVFPYAAILAIAFGVFVIAVVILLVVRKFMVKRGVQAPCGCGSCSALMCTGGTTSSCFEREGCREVLERMDCSTPDCRVWLDNICPTRQQCSTSFSMLCSCVCCHTVAESCQDIQFCPDCSAMEIPEMQCCCNCNFKVKLPDCNHINCLCFECGRPEPAG